MSSVNIKILKYCATGYLTLCVSYSGTQGIYKGYEMANHTCFNKKNMTPTENIFEYCAYGTILFSSTIMYIISSPIYTPISLYNRISTIF